MLYGVCWILQFGSEKFRIHLPVFIERNPHQVFFAVIFREALADRRKSIRHFHIEEKRDLINQLIPIGRHVAIEIVFMHKAKTVNFHLNACFLQHFTDDSLFCCFTEFYPAANGVEIVSVIANHQKLSIFHDDRTGTNIQDPVVTGDAHILVHCSFSISFSRFSGNADHTAAELFSNSCLIPSRRVRQYNSRGRLCQGNKTQ